MCNFLSESADLFFSQKSLPVVIERHFRPKFDRLFYSQNNIAYIFYFFLGPLLLGNFLCGVSGAKMD